MSEYDKYLAKLADDYNRGCEPETINVDEDGLPGDKNCNYCDNKDCEHWAEYNVIEVNNSYVKDASGAIFPAAPHVIIPFPEWQITAEEAEEIKNAE